MNLVFTWEDLRRIIKSKQKVIIQVAILVSCVVLGYFLMAPLEYETWATFKQAPSRDHPSFDIKNILRSFSFGGSEGSSTTVMLSDVVLEKTIEKTGLQAELASGSRLYRFVTTNILAEIGRAPQDVDSARFSSVRYLGEKPLSMILKKVSETEFALYDTHHLFLTSGTIGEPLAFGEFEFTLCDLPLKDEAVLTLHPIQSAIHSLRNKLTIKPTREDKNLLLIKYLHQDRWLGAEIVNALMEMYEKYLVDENKMIIKAQLSYLNQRQDELAARLDQDIKAHAAVLQNNLQTQGFLGIKDEMGLVLEPLQTHKLRLDDVELELRQIEEQIAKAQHETKQTHNEPLLIERYSQALAEQIRATKTLLAQVRRKEKISANSIEELQPAIEAFNLALENPASEGLPKIEPLLREFLSHLKLRKQSLHDNSQWIQTAQNDLSSMNLKSARKQFNQYSAQFDELHACLKQVMFMRDHVFDPHFEISTLTNILSDAVTQQIVHRSSEIEAQLHDDIHRSNRDRDRLKATLAIHKRFLESHLNQTLQLGKIRIDLLKEKLSSLYTVMKTLLIQEQDVLKEKIGQLKHSMQSLPELWVQENRLKFKSDLTKGMMEGLVSMAESKNLAHHLYQVESRPLDKARPPVSFVKPLLLTKAALAFFLSLMALATLAILHALIKGFPVSLATLRELGAHTSGPLSLESPLLLERSKDTDRETLRNIAAFLLEERSIVAVIGERQTGFFPALTALLKKHQKTSCVIDCSFGKIVSSQEIPGLFQALTNELPPLRTFSSYDFLPVGASCPDGVELLKSNAFERLIHTLSSRYDYLFLLSRTAVHSLESQAVLSRSSRAILVAETSLEMIKPHQENTHVTFIQY